MNSIRVRLSAYLLLAAVLTALVIGGITYRFALSENERLFDYQLRQIALSLRDHGFVDSPRSTYGSDGQPLEVVIQIWTANGAILYLSHPGNPVPERITPGYSDVTAGQRRWRVYCMTTANRIIQVAQPLELRRDLAASAAVRSLTPLLAFAPVMAMLIWWLVGSSLSPVRRLASEVQQRDVHSLEKVSTENMPDEIAPLAHALNLLLARLKHAFARQRAFVADAAHELRSPLTALKLQLQLLAQAPDDMARQDAMDKLHAGVDRATHLIEQLITAARTEPDERTANAERVDLVETTRQGMADIFWFAQQRRTQIGLDAPEHAGIAADAAGLRILIRNLLDNAIRYAPEEGSVRVTISRQPGTVTLSIEDDGPGISEADEKRVFDRFYRANQHDQAGSGLGLSIVKNVADQHKAGITLGRSDLGGLKVSVIFPE